MTLNIPDSICYHTLPLQAHLQSQPVVSDCEVQLLAVGLRCCHLCWEENEVSFTPPRLSLQVWILFCNRKLLCGFIYLCVFLCVALGIFSCSVGECGVGS